MPFRGFDSEGPEFFRDPLTRFLALDQAFDTDRPVFATRAPQRLAAVNLVLTPAEPVEVAAAVRHIAHRVRARASFSTGHSIVHLILAAIVLRHGDDADSLIDEIKRVRPIMRRVGLRWSPDYEMVAILTLRIQTRGPIADAQIERMRAIYEAMKVHHWWLTGPEDFPACALLCERPGSPTQLADRAHAVYELLRRELGMIPGDPLQTTSNILALADAEPGELVERYGALVDELERHGHRLVGEHYDELALLCFLPRSSASVAATVVQYQRALREHEKWYEQPLSFTLAANLAFMHIVGDDPELGPLADVKALLDMFWLLTQQR